MSIMSALNAAQTGLKANARLAEMVSANVANAMTPGYARRSLELSSLMLGGGIGSGVRVSNPIRAEHLQVTAERRLMAAAAGSAATLGAARERILQAVGEPGMPGALATRATAFETALLGAAASPSSTVKLGEAVDAAKALLRSVAAASQEAADLRTEAEAEIVRQVATLNGALADVEALNLKIKAGLALGNDVSGLEDERGRAIDRIAEIVPVRTAKREGGEIALFTVGGGVLLDGRAYPLRFEKSAPFLMPDFDGPMRGLEQMRGDGDWRPAPIGAPPALLDGGSLSALFEVRDDIARKALAELDTYALDLMQRFTANPPIPPDALGPGGTGLFVDETGLGGTEPGLAIRLALNPTVDPARDGGAVRRLRDGLSAGAAGPESFGDYLRALSDAMTAPRAGSFASTTASLGSAGFAAEIGAHFAAQSARADETSAFLAAQAAILDEQEAALVGVDTDAQLQFLMLVEQAYAANARVLSVIDQLLKELLEIKR